MDKSAPELGPALLFTTTEKLDGLPVLAETQQLVAAFLDGTEDGLRRAGRVMREDPALCANLLRLCAEAAPHARPARMDDALSLLAGDGGQRLLSGHEVVRGLGDRAPLNLQHLREHSVNVALLAGFYARASGHDGEVAYLTGLLHEAGTLAIARHLPTAIRTLLGRTGRGLDLAQVCEALQLPSPLSWTVALLERFGVAPSILRPLLALERSGWPDDDPAAGIRDAVYRAHRLCEAHGGAAPWDRLPELEPAPGPLHVARSDGRFAAPYGVPACLH